MHPAACLQCVVVFALVFVFLLHRAPRTAAWQQGWCSCCSHALPPCPFCAVSFEQVNLEIVTMQRVPSVAGEQQLKSLIQAHVVRSLFMVAETSYPVSDLLGTTWVFP